MPILAKIAIAFVAFEHLFFLYMEMFAWETLGRKIFRGALPAELFTPTKVMAANQGIYNGFLAAGLVWSLLITNTEWARNVAFFFLSCVLVASIVGGITAGRKVIIAQGIPALVALALLYFL